MQGKGKKREVGWFPASYVTLLEGVGGGGGAAAGGANPGQEAEKKSSGVEQGKNSINLFCSHWNFL